MPSLCLNTDQCQTEAPVFKTHGSILHISCRGCWCGLSTSHYMGSKQTQELLGGVKVQVSLFQLGAGEHASILEQRHGWRHVRGAHMPRNTDSARIPADIQHHPDTGLNPGVWRGKDASLPSVPDDMSLCLQLRFISASDSAGPVGLMTAQHWGTNKKRFTARSAPQTMLCCLCPRDQNSSSADTTAKRNPGVPQPSSVSP